MGIVIALLAIEVIFLAAMGLPALFGDNLQGRWNLDDIIMYEFVKDGKGIMHLPSVSYEFEYQAKDGSLHIDFLEEAVTDCVYTYEIEDNTMILTDTETAVSYTLLKK